MLLATADMIDSCDLKLADSRKPDSCLLSGFRTTVTLKDWWLIMHDTGLDGKKLAVAGFGISQNGVRRLFSSAPLATMHDVFSLETVDSVWIILSGFINKLRTMENGFTCKVFDHFVFGFPPNWEALATSCRVENAVRNTNFCNDIPTTPLVASVVKSPVVNNFGNVFIDDVRHTLVRDPSTGSFAVENPETADVSRSRRQSMKKKVNCFKEPKAESSTPAKRKGGGNMKESLEDHVIKRGSYLKTRKKSARNVGKSLIQGARKMVPSIPLFKSQKKNDEAPADTKYSESAKTYTGNHEDQERCQGVKKTRLLLPESVSVKRSRSGRRLLPTLEFWRNQIPVYDAERNMVGIREDVDL